MLLPLELDVADFPIGNKPRQPRTHFWVILRMPFPDFVGYLLQLNYYPNWPKLTKLFVNFSQLSKRGKNFWTLTAYAYIYARPSSLRKAFRYPITDSVVGVLQEGWNVFIVCVIFFERQNAWMCSTRHAHERAGGRKEASVANSLGDWSSKPPQAWKTSDLTLPEVLMDMCKIVFERQLEWMSPMQWSGGRKQQ